MLSYRDLMTGFRKLDLDPGLPILVHASLSVFGNVRSGADTMLGALRLTVDALMMPTFTPDAEIIPETGPENNGILYGSGKDTNRLAAPFKRRDTPAGKMMGVLAETLRQHPDAERSDHPLLSFAGINVSEALKTQRLDDPLAPIATLAAQGGSVLLLGVDHTTNTAIHLAEQRAGRKTFTRWAVTGSKIVACTHYPGCSDGFGAAEQALAPITREVVIGEARVRALQLAEMLALLTDLFREEPEALLCEREDCPRCAAIRKTAG